MFAAVLLASGLWGMIGFGIAAICERDEKKTIEKYNEELKKLNEQKKDPLSHEDRMLLFSDIVEAFEDLLKEKGIEIENDEKKEVLNASNIYGTDYGNLVFEIEKILIGYGLLEKER